jgi:type I restriction enzyme M protein
MFVQAFRAIDDCLRQEAGCGTELDSTEQTSWLLFLKTLDGREDDNAPLAGDDRLPGGEAGAFTHPMV